MDATPRPDPRRRCLRLFRAGAPRLTRGPNRDYSGADAEGAPVARCAQVALRAHDQRLLRDALVEQLQDADATQETRNRFRLRRPSVAADYELPRGRRAGPRVMFGRKLGNQVLVEGRRFVL